MEKEKVDVKKKRICTHFENPFEDWDSTPEKDSRKVNTLYFVYQLTFY